MVEHTTMPEKPSSTGMTLLKSLLPYIIAVAAAFAAVGVLLALMGFNVFQAYATILFTSFRTPNGIVQTLNKFVPLALVTYSFTIPLAAGKFNIGGEGQLIAGAIGAAAVGILFSSLPWILLLPLALAAGLVFGALWMLLPAWLLYRFNINEILTTVLMNFVAFETIDYVATKVWPDLAAGHPTTVPIGPGGRLPMLVANPPLHSGLLIAIVVSILVTIYIGRTSAGYDLIATGANPRASRVFGIKVGRMFFLSMMLGGAVAGLAGAIEVTGVHGRLIEGLQSNFLLLGIVIGLIAKGNNGAAPFVAFFIAVLEVGASAMQRTLQIPGEMVLIVEALILIFVLLSDVVQRRRG